MELGVLDVRLACDLERTLERLVWTKVDPHPNIAGMDLQIERFGAAEHRQYGTAGDSGCRHQVAAARACVHRSFASSWRRMARLDSLHQRGTAQEEFLVTLALVGSAP